MLISNFFTKEIRNALEAASLKAKLHYYEKFDIYSEECKLAESQNFCFNKIKEITETVSVTGLLLVRLLKLIIDWWHALFMTVLVNL